MNNCEIPVLQEGGDMLQVFELFPFKSLLSLDGLVDYWRNRVDSENPIEAELANSLVTKVESFPELQGVIEDHSVLAPHQELINLMMSAVMPQGLDQDYLGFASPAYAFKPFYISPKLVRLMPKDKNKMHPSKKEDVNEMFRNKIMYACGTILEKVYGVSVMEEPPMIFSVPDHQTELLRYYKASVITPFVNVKVKDGVQLLTEKEIAMLLDNMGDLDLWLTRLNPDDYQIEGFVIMSMVDVTVEETLSILKYDLLDKSATTSLESRAEIEKKLRNLFGIPDLRLGGNRYAWERQLPELLQPKTLELPGIRGATRKLLPETTGLYLPGTCG